MSPFQKLRDWLSFDEDEKMLMERRAFLKGMTVTSAGLLVPGAAVFDLGRVARPRELKSRHLNFEIEEQVVFTQIDHVKDPALTAQRFIEDWNKTVDFEGALIKLSREFEKYGDLFVLPRNA